MVNLGVKYPFISIVEYLVIDLNHLDLELYNRVNETSVLIANTSLFCFNTKLHIEESYTILY